MAGKKGPNFTELEKCILVELIGSRREIIEGKGSDAKMIEKKNKEWDDLAAEFNSRHGVHQRTVTQLRFLWKNLKSKTKSDVAKERREKSKTGGGHRHNFSLLWFKCIPQHLHDLNNVFFPKAESSGKILIVIKNEWVHSISKNLRSPVQFIDYIHLFNDINVVFHCKCGKSTCKPTHNQV